MRPALCCTAVVVSLLVWGVPRALMWVSGR